MSNLEWVKWNGHTDIKRGIYEPLDLIGKKVYVKFDNTESINGPFETRNLAWDIVGDIANITEYAIAEDAND